MSCVAVIHRLLRTLWCPHWRGCVLVKRRLFHLQSIKEAGDIVVNVGLAMRGIQIGLRDTFAVILRCEQVAHTGHVDVVILAEIPRITILGINEDSNEEG